MQVFVGRSGPRRGRGLHPHSPALGDPAAAVWRSWATTPRPASGPSSRCNRAPDWSPTYSRSATWMRGEGRLRPPSCRAADSHSHASRRNRRWPTCGLRSTRGRRAARTAPSVRLPTVAGSLANRRHRSAVDRPRRRGAVLGGPLDTPTSVGSNATKFDTIVDHLVIPLSRLARRMVVERPPVGSSLDPRVGDERR